MILLRRKQQPVPALDLGTTPINGTYPVVMLRQIAAELREGIEQLDAAIERLEVTGSIGNGGNGGR